MKSILLLVIYLSSYVLFAQTCNIDSEIKKTKTLYNKGDFNTALSKTQQLLICDSLTNLEVIVLHTIEYKLLRNTFKNNKAHKAILKAKKIFDNTNLISDLNFKMLLAESFAFVRKDTIYNTLISKIENLILSTNSSDSLIITRYYHSKFLITDKTGDTYKAIEFLQKGLAFVGNNSVYYKVEILKNLGNMNRVLGDYDKSLSFYQREFDLLSTVYKPDHLNIATSNYHLGTIYYEKLEYQKALNHFLKAHKVWKNIYKPDYNYMRYLNEAIGDMYWELYDKKNALKYFDFATTQEKIIDNDISKSYIIIADSLLKKGNYNSAINYYNNAYEWRKKTFGKNHVVTGACQNFVARAIESSGKIEDALDGYQLAIDILVKEMDSTTWYDNPTLEMTFQSHHYLLESLSAKANLLKQLYKKNKNLKDLKTAFSTQEIAIQVIEQMKNGQMSESSRLFWTNRVTTIIEKSIAIALQLYHITKDKTYLEKAFHFSEKNKALLLLAVIQEQDIESFSNIPKQIIEQEKELKKNITQLTGKITNEENRCAELREKMISLWRTDLNSKQNEYDILLNNIKTEYPDFYKLKYDVKIANLKTIQNELLDNQTSLISYFIGPEHSYVFHITQQDITIRKIENSEKLSEEVLTFFNLLNSKQKFTKQPQEAFLSYSEKAYQLYKKLLQNEVYSLKTNKLIIIPDGLLAYIPFESLLTKQNKSEIRNYKQLPYLIKSFAVTYSPSATIQLFANKKSETARKYLGFAPDYEQQEYTETRTKLANLRFNKQEVEQASQLFNGKHFTGNLVTEDLIKTKTSKTGILHLAMHGNVEDEQPLLSKLYFNSSEKEDGLLHTYEIYNLDIPAQLVILSACNTATGKLQKGEGILSLERAFQYAGSKALLSTLWTVDDASSSKLMLLFLENLKTGNTKDIALQKAKLDYLEGSSPEYLPPFYWSSFKLTGSAKALIKASNINYLIIGSGIILILAFFLFRKKKQNKIAA